MKKLAVAAVAFFLLLLLAGLGNTQGVCFVKMRSLSNEERINAAVDHLLQNIKPGGRVFAMREEGLVEVSPTDPDSIYQGVNDFLRRNPNCCSVTSVNAELGHSPGFSARLAGNFSSYVRVEYLDPGDLDVALRGKKKISYLAVTNCGDVWNGI